jgi:hypothetical protein
MKYLCVHDCSPVRRNVLGQEIKTGNLFFENSVTFGDIPGKSANIQFPICVLVCPLQTRITMHKAATLSTVLHGRDTRSGSPHSVRELVVEENFWTYQRQKQGLKTAHTEATCKNLEHKYYKCGLIVHENIPATTKLWVKMGWAEGERIQGDCTLLDTEIYVVVVLICAGNPSDKTAHSPAYRQDNPIGRPKTGQSWGEDDTKLLSCLKRRVHRWKKEDSEKK